MLLASDLPTLRCPSCQDSLVYQGTYLELVIKDGVLICKTCEQAWHCENDLPRLMTEDTGGSYSPRRARLATLLPSFRDPFVKFGLPLLQMGGTECTVRSGLLQTLDLDGLTARDDDTPIRLLEVGVGTGGNLAKVKNSLPEGLFTEIWASDHRPGMLAECRLRLGEQLVDEDPIRVIMAAPTCLPFDDATFDRVFEFGSLIGFEDAALVLAEMARVTRSGGQVTMVEPILSSDANGWQRQGFSFFTLGDTDTPALTSMVPGDALDIRCEQISPFYQALSFRVA